MPCLLLRAQVVSLTSVPGGIDLADTATKGRQLITLDRVVIRFAGDSGDGMQLAGDRFTTSSAIFGNDLSTLAGLPG